MVEGAGGRMHRTWKKKSLKQCQVNISLCSNITQYCNPNRITSFWRKKLSIHSLDCEKRESEIISLSVSGHRHLRQERLSCDIFLVMYRCERNFHSKTILIMFLCQCYPNSFPFYDATKLALLQFFKKLDNYNKMRYLA